MELRWYETYDKYGKDSGRSLQFRESCGDEWQEVPYVRELETNYLKPEDE